MSMPSAMPAGSAPWSAPRVLSAIVVFVTDSEAIGAGAGSPERVDVSSAPIPAPMPPGAGVTPERRLVLPVWLELTVDLLMVTAPYAALPPPGPPGGPTRYC